MADIGAVAQTGAISTQVAAIQKPLVEAAPAPRVEEATPPPPPPPEDSGRGETVDTTA